MFYQNCYANFSMDSIPSVKELYFNQFYLLFFSIKVWTPLCDTSGSLVNEMKYGN